MSQDIIAQRVRTNPKYAALKKTRNRYGWIMTALMMLVYYGYILLVAFDKEFLSQKMGDGVMSIGMPIGVGVIVFTIVITGIYVRRANNEFDAIKADIVKEALK